MPRLRVKTSCRKLKGEWEVSGMNMEATAPRGGKRKRARKPRDKKSTLKKSKGKELSQGFFSGGVSSGGGKSEREVKKGEKQNNISRPSMGIPKAIGLRSGELRGRKRKDIGLDKEYRNWLRRRPKPSFYPTRGEGRVGDSFQSRGL